MKVNLSIQEKLEDLRKEKGLTFEQLSEETGISKSTLANYEKDDYKDISHSYLLLLAKYYDVSADWLLGISESREIRNHDIADLHLDDETLNIIKSGKLNNRLLCEMIKHPDFLKLMTDIEIYIDGIATMQIRSMNDWLDAVRVQVVQQHHPESNDLYLQVLNAASINEEEYFFHNIHGDLDRVIKAIRKDHQNDPESAPISDAFNDKKVQALITKLKVKSNPVEEFWQFFCNTLQINYENSLKKNTGQ